MLPAVRRAACAAKSIPQVALPAHHHLPSTSPPWHSGAGQGSGVPSGRATADRLARPPSTGRASSTSTRWPWTVQCNAWRHIGLVILALLLVR